ncbi:L-2-hydroxyglutarate oxidase [Salinirubellus sp. GCM10025818]|uniref:L-2-hydroxyglutarate oxidase n=1 Tax=Salinirubellus TaxID=2162630 RepID=UPI0030CB3371
MSDHDVAVIGGGCVGLSVAKHLLERDSTLDVCVIEKEYHLAEHQSGRNSGVLHPGFNYPPGSLKARFATEGTSRMKSYCRENGIPLEEFGVVVAATDDAEVERLDDLDEQAEANGVEASIIDGDELREHEPHAAGIAALYCPEAASVDSQQYVYTLAREVSSQGTTFYMGHEVECLDEVAGGHRIETSNGRLTADYVVNAAGLYADRLAQQVGVGHDMQVVPFRGEYYELVPERRDICRTMIYPTPDPELPFLGVHYTRRTDGKVIVGPNAVLAFGREAYRNTDFDLGELKETLGYEGFWRLVASRKMLGVAVDELGKSYRKERFVEASRKLVPGVREEDFARSYAGIRAQLVSDDGQLVKDPVFEHGARSTHVLNAVSPGLTSSLPFGEHVAEQVAERL